MPIPTQSQIGGEQQTAQAIADSVSTQMRVAMPGIIQSFDPDAVFPETDISDVSLELIAAIKQGYLTVKAAGVWAGDVETPSVEAPSEGSKFFGFDMDNEYIGGFDVGAWGTIL